VICIGRYNPAITDILAAIKPDVIDYPNKITFENASDAVFAFDPANPVYNSNMLFQKPYLLEGSPDYPLRWKFMTTGSGMDKVVAKMPAGIEQNKETLKFVVTSNNTEVDYTPGAAGSDIVLNLMPATADAVYSVHAVVKNKETGKWQQAGRFDVFTRTPKNYSVTLVPIGGSVTGDVASYLNEKWKRYGITWTVNIDNQFYTGDRVATIDEIIGTSIESDADVFLSEYTPKQRALNISFRDYVVAKEKYSKDEMYVFVLTEGKAPVAGQVGDMPLGKQWGYLFIDNVGTDEDYHTLAHELGHGKTKLDHTFYDKTIAQNSTTNLMDYTGGDTLVRCQWEYIHNPAVFDPAQDDEDAANQYISDPVCTQKFIEMFRWAYVNKKPLNYPGDGFPNKGHYAKDIVLLDGTTYNKISIEVRRDIGFEPFSISPQMNYGRADYLYGSDLYFYTVDNYSEFNKYMFPTAAEYNQQMSSLIEKISSSTITRKEILNLLSVIPKEEYGRLNVDARINCLNKISEGFITADYISCVNDEQIVLDLINDIQLPADQKKLMDALFTANSFMGLLKGLDGEELTKFIFKVSEFINLNYPKPSEYELTRYFIDNNGTYNKVFLWEQTAGPDVLYHSTASRTTGKFMITGESDWWFDDENKVMDLLPYEFIGITAKTDIKHLNVTAGQFVVIPSVLFHWLLKENDKDQAWDNMFKAIEAGIMIGSLGTYAEGKVLYEVATKMSIGMAMDFTIQAAIGSIGEKTFEQAVHDVNYRNAIWSGITSIMTNSKLKLTHSCVRAGINAAGKNNYDNLEEIIIQGTAGCVLEILVNTIFNGVFPDDSKYMQMLKSKFEENPNAVVKELLEMKIDPNYINSVSQRICSKTTKEAIKKILKSYGYEF
jgi:hypothetical protein